MNAAIAAPPSQATGRHRGDSNRPVGKNNSVNSSARNTVGYHAHEAYQAATIAPGSQPGRVK